MTVAVRASNNWNWYFLGETSQGRELMEPFKATGYCHRSDPVERTSVDSLLVLPHLLMFLLFQSCLLAPRRSLRQQNSTHQVQNRVGNHERRIFCTVHGIKDREKTCFWPLNEDCREGQHLMVCKHKLRAINALLIPTIIPFRTGSPDEYKEYWFLNPCRFLETMQTDLIIINKIYRQWCNPAEAFLPKSMA